MGALLDVILPVFMVMGAGYLARWRNLFSDTFADGLMVFAQRFAIPAMLFLAMSELNLAQGFDPGLLASFYIGVAAFMLGAIGARLIFGRTPEDSVSIGFASFFSNSVLLGLAIMQRAYGPGALAPNYALIAIHAPLLYVVGIIAMETVKSRGAGVSPRILLDVTKSIMTNVIGIGLGIVANLTGFRTPETVDAALQMLARAALPAALFGLGAVLYRYRPEGDIRVIMMVGFISLIVHPAVTWVLATQVFGLNVGQLRAAIVTAAMAPGVNAYLFANMYGAAPRVAASSVLIRTALSLVTAWAWLSILP